MGELGADAAKLQREAKEGARQGPPVQIIIAAFPLILLKIDSEKSLAGIDQLGGQDAEGGFAFPTLARLLLV